MLKESVKDGRSSNIILANCLKLRCTQRQALIAHVYEFIYVHVHVLVMLLLITCTCSSILCGIHVHACMYITCRVHVCVVFD